MRWPKENCRRAPSFLFWFIHRMTLRCAPLLQPGSLGEGWLQGFPSSPVLPAAFALWGAEPVFDASATLRHCSVKMSSNRECWAREQEQDQWAVRSRRIREASLRGREVLLPQSKLRFQIQPTPFSRHREKWFKQCHTNMQFFTVGTKKGSKYVAVRAMCS